MFAQLRSKIIFISAEWAQIAAGKGFAEGARSLCITSCGLSVPPEVPSLVVMHLMQTAPAIVPYLLRSTNTIEQPNATTTATTTS
jgi:hypothetical protein